MCLSVFKLAPAEYAMNTFRFNYGNSKAVVVHNVVALLAVVVHVLQTTQNLVVISRCSFVEDGKEMYKDLTTHVHSYCFAH